MDSGEPSALRRDWAIFAAITFLFGFGWAVYDGVFQNFFRSLISGDPFQLGILESIRETPGLIAALMAGLLVGLAEARVAGLGLVICGVGIGLTAATSRFWPLVMVTTLWSVGFHLWSTVSPAITLNLARGVEGGRHFGRMRSVAAVATISALALSWGSKQIWPTTPYGAYFIVGGVAIGLGGLLAYRLSPLASGLKRQPLIFRREYGLFYLLQFLEGCRRQIFSIFALFTLILVFNTPVEVVLLLRLINSVLSALLAPSMGRMIDRLGEKVPLTIYSISIIAIFAGYATIKVPLVLYALYVVDNVMFTFSIGFNTYLHRIVRPGEMTPCLAMGVTMNHVAAVSLPLIGAYVWHRTGNYQIPFAIGMGLAIVALVATQWIPDSDSRGKPLAGEEPKDGDGA